jgi:hypothetical protein
MTSLLCDSFVVSKDRPFVSCNSPKKCFIFREERYLIRVEVIPQNTYRKYTHTHMGMLKANQLLKQQQAKKEGGWVFSSNVVVGIA